VRFGPFELDARAVSCESTASRSSFGEQPVRILVMLVEQPGEVVLREEIRLRLWPTTPSSSSTTASTPPFRNCATRWENRRITRAMSKRWRGADIDF